MPHRKRHLVQVAALPILFVFLASPVDALPLDRVLPDLFARGWSLLSVVWAEAGCSVDPYGRCGALSAQPRTILSEEGGCLELNGRCGALSAPSPVLRDAGCGINPHGLCRH